MASDTPTEFRVFEKGWNETTKGRFLFDDKAARSLMANYEKRGVDGMIDLEHLSIDTESNSYDPDARGWYNLKMRDGELWAVHVRWNSDGERRLKSLTQRYISPAFAFDPKTKRILSLYNMAICAVPATYEIPALVAASQRSGKKLAVLAIGAGMDEMKKICSALGLEEDATLEQCLSAIKALAEDGGGDSDEVMKKLRKMLAMDDDADGEEVMKKLAEKIDDEDPPGKGEDDKEEDDAGKEQETARMANQFPKLAGELMALRSNSKQTDERLAKLEALSGKSEVENLIAKNIDKLPRHLEAWAHKQSVETLSGFFASAQPVKREPAKEKKRDSEEEVHLTDDDKRMAKLANVAPELILKQKREDAQKRAERMS